ncbi:uncharacterized protein LOC115821730 [Chanos chanos]|uniref:Uncharacterized protein LOC115821730 n=1 Tax=Chanos chanos TaxID=29144 RepID=A0A6J2W7H4_CHACN|nr:uncharacterized protein LOC115821730 [Chanos chanos]
MRLADAVTTVLLAVLKQGQCAKTHQKRKREMFWASWLLISSGFLLRGVSGQNITVYSRHGDDVTLPCHDVGNPNCSSTTWTLSYCTEFNIRSNTQDTEMTSGRVVIFSCVLHPDDGGCRSSPQSFGLNLNWTVGSNFPVSGPVGCPNTLAVKLQEEDNNRTWTCQLTKGEEVMASVSYVTKWTVRTSPSADLIIRLTIFSILVFVPLIFEAVFYLKCKRRDPVKSRLANSVTTCIRSVYFLVLERTTFTPNANHTGVTVNRTPDPRFLEDSRIISHIKTSVSLHIMCHIPVFCWISATVLQEMLRQDNVKEIPKTLTEMYTHFLLIQTKMEKQKYEEKVETDSKNLLESNKETFLKIAKLAFNQLLRGNIMFYEEDLRECGLDVSDATVYSGICTEIFKEESVLHQKKVYCFVHLSVQEFFAALYVFYWYVNRNMEALEYFLQEETTVEPNNVPLDKLLKKAVDKSLESKDGRLDLFVRFLHGISLESNQKLLQGLLTHTHNNQISIKEISQYIKELNKDDVPPERWINLLHCLTEMNDHSLHEEIQAFVKSGNYTTELSLAHCTALAYMFLMSEEVLDEFDLKKYNTSDEGCRRLLPAVRCCRKALLRDYNLTQQSCETIASALKSVNCPLRELDLRSTCFQDSGVMMLCAALKNLNCKLEILRLASCKLTEQSCSSIASVLQSVNCPLRELDLSNNDLQDSGVKFLCVGLKNPHCKLEILRLALCKLTEQSCSSIASVLQSVNCPLRELDLSNNDLQDSGLDTNTVNTHLSLSEGNRKLTRVGKNQSYPDHPERFDDCLQVMCRESLTGRCYWETEWSGCEADISVTYKGIRRKGMSDDCVFGNNEKSWSLSWYCNSYTARHNKQFTDLPHDPSHTHRVGVYLDWSSGTVSFYSVSSDTHTLTHIHTFHSTFTEPLYAAMGEVGSDCEVAFGSTGGPYISCQCNSRCRGQLVLDHRFCTSVKGGDHRLVYVRMGWNAL